MVTVPTYTERKVLTGDMPDTYQRVRSTPEDFGSLQGEALANAGRSLTEAGGTLSAIMGQQQQDLDEAEALKKLAEARKEKSEFLYNPESGLYAKKGENAVNASQDFEGGMSTIGQRYMESLTSDRQKKIFGSAWLKENMTDHEAVNRHVLNETQEYRVKAGAAAADSSVARGVEGYTDPKIVAQSEADIGTAVRTTMKGFPETTINDAVRSKISSMHRGILERMVIADPKAAIEYRDKNRSKFTGPDLIDIDKTLEPKVKSRAVDDEVNRITGKSGASRSLFRATQPDEEKPKGDIKGDYIPNGLVQSVAFAENASGDPMAVSPAGAVGGMQVMPRTALGVSLMLGDGKLNPGMTDAEITAALQSDPNAANHYGEVYLDQQLKKYKGDVEVALIAYNAGPRNADKFIQSGRDYSVLPKREETEPYVRKVMSKFAQTAAGSPYLQNTARNMSGSLFGDQGDVDQVLRKHLNVDKNDEHITGLSGSFKQRLAAMISTAPEEVQKDLKILSGNRSVERQRQLFRAAVAKYGSEAAARKWVAPPGRSNHNHGSAIDFDNRNMKSTTVAWLHENAGQFGLYFPMGHEPWHIEPTGTRGTTDTYAVAQRGQPERASQPGRVQVAALGAEATGVASDAQGGYMATTIQEGTPDGAPLPYGQQVAQANTADTSEDDYDGWLSEAEKIEDPDIRASVISKLDAEYERRKRLKTIDEKAVQKEAWAQVIGGKSVKDLEPSLLQKLDPSYVSSLYAYEDKIEKDGKIDQDWEAWYQFNRMPDDELRNMDVYKEYRLRLDDEHFDKAVARQKDLLKEGGGASSAGMRTSTQIVDATLKGADITDNAKIGKFESAFDKQVQNYTQINGKPPNSTEMQKIADRMLIDRTEDTWGWDSTVLQYEQDIGAGRRQVADIQSIYDAPPDDINTIYTNGKRAGLFRGTVEPKEVLNIYKKAVQAAENNNVPLPDKYKNPTDGSKKSAFQQKLETLRRKSLSDAELQNEYNNMLKQLLVPNNE